MQSLPMFPLWILVIARLFYKSKSIPALTVDQLKAYGLELAVLDECLVEPPAGLYRWLYRQVKTWIDNQLALCDMLDAFDFVASGTLPVSNQATDPVLWVLKRERKGDYNDEASYRLVVFLFKAVLVILVCFWVLTILASVL